MLLFNFIIFRRGVSVQDMKASIKVKSLSYHKSKMMLCSNFSKNDEKFSSRKL